MMPPANAAPTTISGRSLVSSISGSCQDGPGAAACPDANASPLLLSDDTGAGRGPDADAATVTG